MKDNLTSLSDKEKLGDLSEEIAKIERYGLPGLTGFSPSGFKKGVRRLKKELVKAEKEGGANHTSIAHINYLLGDAYMRHGRPDSAEPYLLRAMQTWADTDLGYYKGIIHLLLDLAGSYGESGEIDDSERLGRIILDSVKTHLSEGDLLIVSALTDLGATLGAQRRLSEAEVIFREALNQSEKNTRLLYGSGPRILMNLAALSTLRGEFPEAETHLNRALEIAEAAEDEDRDDVHVLEIFCNKAKVCAASGKSAALEGALERVESAYEAAWESEPETVVPLILDLARLLHAFGSRDAVEKIYRRMTEDSVAALKLVNKKRGLAIIDAWLDDFKHRGGDPSIGEVWRENRKRFEAYCRRMNQ